MAGKELPAGIPSHLYQGMEFLEWAQNQRQKITYRMIMDRFDCCRATSFRYLRAYEDFITSREARSAA